MASNAVQNDTGAAAPSDEELRAKLASEKARADALHREVRMLRIANSELERVALRDTLTPVFNRRYFANALNDRLARMRRYGTRAAVVFVDIDTMKQINDAHGHGAGDFVLIHVASRLTENVRTTDVVARIGGDEFGVILDEADEGAALIKLESLDLALRGYPCIFDDIPLDISASFGLTMLTEDDNEDAVLRRADAEMYRMKRERLARRSET